MSNCGQEAELALLQKRLEREHRVRLEAEAIAERSLRELYEKQQALVQETAERRRLEQQFLQAQKMEVIGQLAGGVAHDFNNLLTVILGYGELLLRGNVPASSRGLIEEIMKAGNRAAGLTHQLLAFSRQLVLAPKVLDLNLIVRDTEKMLGRLIGENIKLTSTLHPTLSRVKVDPGQIGQVIMNLAVNARDAMPGGGTLTIETSNVDVDQTFEQLRPEFNPGRYVLLAVSDTGCGMDEATRAHIFEPFFTTKAPGHGTGLGLATVYGIVKQSGGYVYVDSEPGVGTTFKIYLPAVEEGLSLDQPACASAKPMGTETLLLVEDEDAVRTFVRNALQMYGYTVLEARSGEEALRIYRQHEGRIHLLVTDVVMPEMTGRQLAEGLAKSKPRLKVLYLSGYTPDTVVRHGVLENETAFLQKPFTPLALAQKVREALDKHRKD